METSKGSEARSSQGKEIEHSELRMPSIYLSYSFLLFNPTWKRKQARPFLIVSEARASVGNNEKADSVHLIETFDPQIGKLTGGGRKAEF